MRNALVIVLLLASLARAQIAGVDGGVDNLRVTNTSTTNVTITADTITMYDADGAALTTNNVSLTCAVSGTIGANGPDAAGVLGSSVTVYLWAIHNGTTVASLASRGATRAALTLPSGYVFARILSYNATDGSSLLTTFKQHGILYQVAAAPQFTDLLALDVALPPNFGVTANVSQTGIANDAGVLNLFPRADHTHRGVRTVTAGTGITVTGGAGGSGDLTVAATGSSGVPSIGAYFGILANGTSGVTQTAIPVALTLDYGLTANVSPTGIANDAGSVAKPARADHTHKGVERVTGGSGILVSGGAGGVGALTLTATTPAFRNCVRNPYGMVVQRGASIVSPASGAYTIDGWVYGAGTPNSATVTITKDADVPTFAQAGILIPSSIKIDCTAVPTTLSAATVIYYRQPIEGHFFSPCAGQSFSVGFWFKGPKTGVNTVALHNSDGGRSYVHQFTVASANAWEWFSFVAPNDIATGNWNLTTGIGLYITFPLACGTDFDDAVNDTWTTAAFEMRTAATSTLNLLDNTANNVFVTGITVEPGGNVGPLELRPLPIETTICMRYYERFTANAALDFFAMGQAYMTTEAYFCLPFTVRKRLGGGTYSDSADTDFTVFSANGAQLPCVTVVGSQITDYDMRITITAALGLTLGQATMIIGESTAAWIAVSSEL